MKVLMVMAASINGKTTNGSNSLSSSWASKEDQTHFYAVHKKSTLLVMGRKTYEANRPQMTFKNHQLRIVMTNHPERYRNDAIPGKLKFTNESPRKLIERLSNKGYKTMLLLGGSRLNAAFIKDKLVNELLLTIEPKLFGKGNPLIADECPDINLRLLTVKRLNPQGTLLLRYRIEP